MPEPLIAIIIILSISSIFSFILVQIQKKLVIANTPNSLIDDINKLLPQTQCGQCNYPGCKPYATAISKFEADINLCPPGGQKTIDNLALLLNIPSKKLSATVPQKQNQKNLIAKIDESTCIGCLLCIKACPVSAIVGANKLMHTVITSQCTGCELCIAPCPMDCISMEYGGQENQ